MDTLNLDIKKRYSYADYLTWLDDVRRELFDGFIKLMTPAPSIKHQIVSVNIELIIGVFLKKKQCKMLHAPSDVRLSKEQSEQSEQSDKKIFTVVQPDIFVVCDLSKLDDKGCNGSPDLIIEIISPKNSKRDLTDKFNIYQEHGIREYWIVNPSDENVNVFVLNEADKYQLVGMYAEDDKIPVNIFNGELAIDLKEVFE